MLAYLDSTCDYLVVRGCCQWEAQFTPGGAINRIINAFGKYGKSLNNFLGKRHCFQIHHGRKCDELLPGDLGIKIPAGQTCCEVPNPDPEQKNTFYDRYPTGERTYYAVAGAGGITDPHAGGEMRPNTVAVQFDRQVCPGEVVRMTVHNNGCLGETGVKKIQDGIKGSLSGNRLVDKGTSLFGSTHFYTLQHYDKDKIAKYDEADKKNGYEGPEFGPDFTPNDLKGCAKGQIDQEVVYTAGSTPGTDTYDFEADGELLRVNFTLKPCSTGVTETTSTPTPSPTPSTVTPKKEVAFFINFSNRVFELPIDSGGTLASVPTADLGTGNTPVSLVVTGLTTRPRSTGGLPPLAVYTLNNGSSDISAFTLDSAGAMTPVPGSPFATGANPGSNFGTAAMAPVPSGRFLYVAGASDVSGYAVDASTGALAPVPGSPFLTGTAPRDLVAVRNGSTQYVYVAETNRVHGLAVNPDGSLTAVPGSPFNFTLPAGWVAFSSFGLSGLAADPAGTYLYAHVGRSSSSEGALLGFAVNSNGALTTLGSSPTLTSASGTVDLVNLSGGTFLYCASFDDDSVHVFSLGSSGQLTEIAGSPFASGNGINRLSVADSASFLYTIGGGGGVVGYSVDPTSGSLTPLTGSPFTVNGFVLDVCAAQLAP